VPKQDQSVKSDLEDQKNQDSKLKEESKSKEKKETRRSKTKIDDYIYSDDETVRRSCLGHWWTATKFYHRAGMTLCSYDRRYYRSIKALNSYTQITFAACLVSVIHGKVSSGAASMLVFILMRPIQACGYLLAYRFTQRRDASKLVFVAALVVLAVSCAALVYDTVASQPKVASSVYGIVFLELLFWDTIMLPSCLVTLIYLPGDGNRIGAFRK